MGVVLRIYGNLLQLKTNALSHGDVFFCGNISRDVRAGHWYQEAGCRTSVLAGADLACLMALEPTVPVVASLFLAFPTVADTGILQCGKLVLQCCSWILVVQSTPHLSSPFNDVLSSQLHILNRCLDIR